MRCLLDEIDPAINLNPVTEVSAQWLLPVLIAVGVLLLLAAVIITVAVLKAKKHRASIHPDSVDVPMTRPLPEDACGEENKTDNN